MARRGTAGLVVDPLTGGVASLAIVGVAAAVFAFLSRRLNLPTVVGFLVAGILCGPVLGVVEIGVILEALGEFGIALLLFLVGLDLSLKEIRAVGPPAFIAGLGQLVGSTIGGYALARYLGFDPGVSLFLAAALAFSSTVVVVKILVDLGDLDKTYGRLAVGVFLVQDIVLVLLLTILPVIGAGAGEAGMGVLLAEATSAAVRTTLIVAGALLAAKHLLPPVFRYAAGNATLLLLLGLTWLFVLVAVSVTLHVSLEVAAFAAGLSLAQMPYATELRRGSHPLLDLFIALFFVTLGVQFRLAEAVSLLPGALVFSVFVILGNWFALTVVLTRMGYSRETSTLTGVTVGQVSEFSFVLAALALAEGLIPPDARDFVILVGMITIAASAALIWRAKRLYAWLERFRWFQRIPDGTRDVADVREAPEGHVLVIGWDAFGARLTRVLLDAGERVVVVDAHPDVPDGLPPAVEGVYGDPEDHHALEDAGLREARLVLANLAEPGLVRVLMDELRADGPPVIARAETVGVARLLRGEGALDVVSPAERVTEEILRLLGEKEVRSRG